MFNFRVYMIEWVYGSRRKYLHEFVIKNIFVSLLALASLFADIVIYEVWYDLCM